MHDVEGGAGDKYCDISFPVKMLEGEFICIKKKKYFFKYKSCKQSFGTFSYGITSGKEFIIVFCCG